MAYVRRRGSQLVLVHGERDSTGTVQQRILFTIYSQVEAREAIGKGSGEGQRQFRAFIEELFPAIRFDWKKISQGIEQGLDALPEEYTYRSDRRRARFRNDLVAFARQLMLGDPVSTSTAELVREHRFELEFVGDLIRQRLEACDVEPNERARDNAFCWRFEMQGDGPPAQVEEMALDLHERGDLDRAEATFRLLLDCFGGYADGHNHLGLVALERDEVMDAIGHFLQAVDLARRRFPKRIAQDRYWNDLDTRPYVRALRNLARALSRLGRDGEALEVCSVLEDECGDSLAAAAFRAPIHLRAGRWEEALRTAKPMSEIWPGLSFVAAFALFELGQREDALAAFLHGALNRPLSARMLVGRRRRGPRNLQETSDHNEGIDVQRDLEPYLMEKGKRSRRFFWRVLGIPQVDAMLDEIVHAQQRNHHQHKRGRREAFDRVTEMGTPQYARERAAELMPLIAKKTGRR